MTTGILYFILLTLVPAQIVVPKFVTPAMAVCGQDFPAGGPGHHLDSATNPKAYFVDDPQHQGKWCKVDISLEIDHLPVGYYMVVPITTANGAPDFAIVGQGNAELFRKS